MKFNSQICTTREQSERLLSLGLKKETADMHYSTDHRGNVRQLWLLAYGDLHEVRNIIALHFSDGLTQMFYDEDERIVRKMESLIKERDTIYKSSKRNSEINAELLNLSQQRKNIKKKAHETMDERDFVLLLQWLRKNHPDVLDAFHATQPKKKPFAKLE